MNNQESEVFTPGQCWISDAELNLGIGLIESIESRFVTVFFALCNEQRTYAKQSAPLTRLTFNVGDTLRSHQGEIIIITAIDYQHGLFLYTGDNPEQQKVVLTETQINPVIQLNRPAQRLANTQIDPGLWFAIRSLSWSHRNQLLNNDLISLTGCRTSLIAHQLYVANNIASRYAPRVLLADEVGLGKTIEAGMILQHQLYNERVKRVLIVVPESLMHQWLIEMHRRFNLRFSIFDEQRCQAEEQSSGMENAFFTEQLILCSLSFLTRSSKRMLQVLGGQWDMLIVDEAHHLQWDREQSSLEYQCIEQLAKLTKAVLLLTATPEQLGKESHFARLRLLDPDRFPDFDQFIKQEEDYQPIAILIEKLQSQYALASKDIQQLESICQISLTELQRNDLFAANTIDSRTGLSAFRQELIEQLLDRHGTGRILFRNTRATVRGFPQRKQIAYPLELPAAYREHLLAIQQSSVNDAQLLLSLEVLYQQTELEPQPARHKSWIEIDGRIDWLAQLIKDLGAEKILIICAFSETAQQLNHILKQKFGIHSAVFHEALNLIERDRAAAYFADEEAGCQVLVCSEIGSEGRNFQFSHHLVLFDLPLNPDLLEQRIGRLDRIGQTEDIQLHIPYFKNSPQELMYCWYSQGLGAFEHLCPAALQIYKQLNPLLVDFLHQIDSSDRAAYVEQQEFIETTQQLSLQLNKKLHQGRDRLLEFNSCRVADAQLLIEKTQYNDQNSQLEGYLEQVFEVLGVDSELHKKNSFIIRPGEKMQLAISGLEDDGLTCTCDRDTALSNEDMQFLNWAHPLVVDVMDQILSSELGNTAMVMVQSADLFIDGNNPIAQGSLLLESLFIIESKASNVQHMFALLSDINGREIPHSMVQSLAAGQIENIDNETIKKIIEVYKDEIKSMIDDANSLASKKSNKLIDVLFLHKLGGLNREKTRLEDLQKINPAVRTEEIEFFAQQIQLLQTNKDLAAFRLDAIRLLVVT
ncbi:MAG: RNA polymerase-associated protein RapA [Pseudomonadota bacterium]